MRRPALATDPASVADRWVRQLEDETGAICESRTDISSDGDVGIASGAEAQAGPGPSTLSSRRSEAVKAYKTRVLPDFYLGSYEKALHLAQKELRPLCVRPIKERKNS